MHVFSRYPGRIDMFEKCKLNKFWAEYRGYGLSTGTQTFNNVYGDADEIFRKLELPPEVSHSFVAQNLACRKQKTFVQNKRLNLFQAETITKAVSKSLNIYPPKKRHVEGGLFFFAYWQLSNFYFQNLN